MESLVLIKRSSHCHLVSRLDQQRLVQLELPKLSGHVESTVHQVLLFKLVNEIVNQLQVLLTTVFLSLEVLLLGYVVPVSIIQE
jgi:hypothetical protein